MHLYDCIQNSRLFGKKIKINVKLVEVNDCPNFERLVVVHITQCPLPFFQSQYPIVVKEDLNIYEILWNCKIVVLLSEHLILLYFQRSPLNFFSLNVPSALRSIIWEILTAGIIFCYHVHAS